MWLLQTCYYWTSVAFLRNSMVVKGVLQTFTSTFISSNAYLIMDHHMPFGAFLLRDIMGCLDNFIPTTNQLSNKLCGDLWILSNSQSHCSSTPTLLSLLPSFQQASTPSTSLIGSCLNDSDILKMLKMASSPIVAIDTFENCGRAKLLPPLHQDVLMSEQVDDLPMLYRELYLEKEVDVSTFCVHSGRAVVCNKVHVIGSTMNAGSCNSSSVNSAYWQPTNTTLSNIDSTRLRIGRVHV